MPVVGILALQGSFAMHAQKLNELGFNHKLVRKAENLNEVEGLIIPGGESSTLLKLLTPELEIAIQEFHAKEKPILTTCAGTILVAKNVTPTQKSLGLIDIHAYRNAYGRQLDSFITKQSEYVDSSLKCESGIDAVFIRAPKIKALTEHIKVLVKVNNEDVLVQQNNVICATFHPELATVGDIYKYFLGFLKKVI